MRRDSSFDKSQTKQKLWQGFALYFVRFTLFDSLKVRESLLIHDSPKWILRAIALSMTILGANFLAMTILGANLTMTNQGGLFCANLSNRPFKNTSNPLNMPNHLKPNRYFKSPKSLSRQSDFHPKAIFGIHRHYFAI